MSRDKRFPVLSILNPNKVWVCNEIDKLISEWKDWNQYCQNLGESPDYNPQTCTEAIKDGFENRRKHEVLREKTLVFMRNHLNGSEFVLENWKSHPHEDNCSRLMKIVPNWIHRLEILKASMDYVLVPEGFWKTKGKELIDTLSKTSAEKAVDVVASYLKNPYDSGA
jgi:hypothetical protein